MGGIAATLLWVVISCSPNRFMQSPAALYVFVFQVIIMLKKIFLKIITGYCF